MRELWAARALANRPDLARARLEPVVDRDIAVRVERDISELQPDPGGIGGASGRDQYVAAFDGLIARRGMQLEVHSLPRPAPHTENLGAEMHRNAFVAQHLQHCGCEVGIFPTGEL